MKRSAKTAVVWDSRCTLHEMGPGHPESPARLFAIKEVLDGDGVGREVGRIEARPAAEGELAFVHDERYIRRIAETAGKEETPLDPDTTANDSSWEAARLAAGGLIRCVEEVEAGRFGNAFAFVRPPGHHAERAYAKGFCLFNNVAIAAEWLIRHGKAERVAIIDFDVHHGNGTQHAFSKRPDVFFASLHRFPFYPGTGAADEIGEGEGRGATLNVPLAAGADDDAYRRALGDRVIPAVERFGPEFLLLSAGFDAHVRDPLGGMRVTTAGFGRMMEAILLLARECCGGRAVATLEGGYDLRALRDAVEAQLEAMTGV